MPAVSLTTAQKIDILRKTISAYSISPEQVGEILMDLLQKSEEDTKNLWSNIQGLSVFLSSHIEDEETQRKAMDSRLSQVSEAVQTLTNAVQQIFSGLTLLSSDINKVKERAESNSSRILTLENRPSLSSGSEAVRPFAAVLRPLGMTYEQLNSTNKTFFCERDGKFVVLDEWGTDRNSDEYSLKFMMGVQIPGATGAGAPMIWGVNFHSADLSWDESGLYACDGRLYRLREGKLVEFCAADNCSGGGASGDSEPAMTEQEAVDMVERIFGDFRLSGSVAGGAAGSEMTPEEGRELAKEIFGAGAENPAPEQVLTKDEAIALVRNIFKS